MNLVSRHMQLETHHRKGKESPAYLDPQMMSRTLILSDGQGVIRYLVRAMRQYSDKEYLMIPYNPGGHWLLINISTKHDRVWYFESNKPRDPDTSERLTHDYSDIMSIISV